MAANGPKQTLQAIRHPWIATSEEGVRHVMTAIV